MSSSINPTAAQGLVDYALQYAGRGWRVFPLRPRGKEPLIAKKAGGRGFADGTTNQAQINTWWARQPAANIGLATGTGLVVLDIDGAAGFAELQRLISRHGSIPRTLAARTGTGIHLFYRCRGEVRSSARGKLHVRGDGGYVVLAPSIHPNGKPYAWIDAAITIAELPDWLQQWMTSGEPQTKNIGPPLQSIAVPAYLSGFPLRPLAQTALKAISQIETNYSPEELRRIVNAMAHIDPDGYDSWYKVGMICKSLEWVRSDGSDIGFDLWDEWSRRSQKYPGAAALEAKWQSFQRDDTSKLGLTVASLFFWASHSRPGTPGAAPVVAPGGGSPQIFAIAALGDPHAAVSGMLSATAAPLRTAAATIGSAAGPLPADGSPGAGADAASIGGMNGREAATAVLPATFLAPTTSIRFELNDAGLPKATARNTRLAIEALGVSCAYDEFHDTTTVGGQVLQEYLGELSDRAEHMLRVLIERTYFFDPKLQNVHDAVIELGLLRQFHPILDYLDGLQWDGRPRIETWLQKYLGADDSDMMRCMGRIVLIAAVRRVREPGMKFDQIMVLEGPEGKNKSTAIRILAGDENFSDQSILTLSDQRQQEAMEGVWLYEIADLTGHSRAEVEKVKAFASRQVDRGRKAYARNVSRQARQCIFFATTNEKRYLISQTGNRRFWPIACGQIDLKGLAADRNQLWAEANYWEERGERIELPERFWQEAAARQDERMEADPWESILANLEQHHCAIKTWPGEWRIFSKDIFNSVLQIPADRQHPVTARRVTYLLQRLGWAAKLLKQGEHVGRGFVKPK